MAVIVLNLNKVNYDRDQSGFRNRFRHIKPNILINLVSTPALYSESPEFDSRIRSAILTRGFVPISKLNVEIVP